MKRTNKFRFKKAKRVVVRVTTILNKLLIVRRKSSQELKIWMIVLSLIFFTATYAAGQKTVQTIPVKHVPPIDGNPDDVLSLMAPYNFFQLEPNIGSASPNETKLVVLQSTDTLYIAIACFQNSDVTAKIKMRDKFGQSDDGIFLIYGLFGWRFKPPFGNLYFIVNHTEYMDPAGKFQNKYIGYLKLTYPIIFIKRCLINPQK